MKKQMVVRIIFLAVVLLLISCPVLVVEAANAEGMDKFNNLIQELSKWIEKVGLVVALFGGIQIALGLKNDDPDGKIRGLKTCAAGFFVYGITKSLHLFGL